MWQECQSYRKLEWLLWLWAREAGSCCIPQNFYILDFSVLEQSSTIPPKSFFTPLTDVSCAVKKKKKPPKQTNKHPEQPLPYTAWMGEKLQMHTITGEISLIKANQKWYRTCFLGMEPSQSLSLPRYHFLFFITLIFSKNQLLLIVIQLL